MARKPSNINIWLTMVHIGKDGNNLSHAKLAAIYNKHYIKIL